MSRIRTFRLYLILILVITMLSGKVSLHVCAAGEVGEPEPEIILDLFTVDIPTVSQQTSSILDFIMDPQQLVSMTQAAKYGGGVVEEGATLLFHNTDGYYNFSSRSDYLTITNYGDTPVQVEVHARIDRLGLIETSYLPVFDDPAVMAIYLAIVDDDGYEVPLYKDEEITYSFTLPAYEAYSFGLTGACNSEAEWVDVYENPVVSLTWSITSPEEIFEEDDTAEEEYNDADDIIELGDEDVADDIIELGGDDDTSDAIEPGDAATGDVVELNDEIDMNDKTGDDVLPELGEGDVPADDPEIILIPSPLP